MINNNLIIDSDLKSTVKKYQGMEIIYFRSGMAWRWWYTFTMKAGVLFREITQTVRKGCIASLQVRYESSDIETKSAILREVADGIIIDEGEVTILWKKPFSFFMREKIIDINKKDVIVSSITSTSAGHEGLEPPALGFGDRCSTN